MPPQQYRAPDHAQANSQLEGLAERMERLQSNDLCAAKGELLCTALMVIARNMPTEPRRQIARIINAYDQPSMVGQVDS